MSRDAWDTRRAFSLLEILLSLLILAGSVIGLMKGLDVAQALDNYSRFEHQAAVFGERELELLKADLIDGRRLPGPASATARIKLPPGWQGILSWTDRDQTGTIRAVARITQRENLLTIGTFVYVPSISSSR